VRSESEEEYELESLIQIIWVISNNLIKTNSKFKQLFLITDRLLSKQTFWNADIGDGSKKCTA